ncbi:MAG: 1-acyl-sn-glycerol-3-phosphate acyltransferase [Gammaproteobacteria bacterium]|nr:MAG: 1-acyl-sn-glycerol-3-phosphate acyltransferase [Gammaproteobacteria bacterium]
MKLLRSLLFSTGMVITIPVTLFALLLLAFAPFRYRFKVTSTWSRAMLAWLRITCGIRYRVEGLEHVAGGATVVLSKHQSTLETLALQVIFQPITWVIKQELLRVPVFGWGLAMVMPIAIDRKAGKKAMTQIVDQGTDRLQKGISVVVFPEGTRTAPGTHRRYRQGGAILAKESGYRILPIAHNAGQCWARREFTKQPGEVVFRIGAPIDMADKSIEEITAEVEQWIESAVAEISDLPPAELIK